ncbi:MAG: cyclic nucleotide-binding domain-containing protein [Pseudomonadota bacterium]
MTDQVFRAVREVPLLRGLSDKQVQSIASKAERIVYESGDVLLERDTVCEAATIIVAGDAEDVSSLDDMPDPIGAGSVLAEMAMVVDIEAATTVVAKTNIKALRIHQADLIAELSDDPAMSERLIDEVTARLRSVAADLETIETSLATEQPRLLAITHATASPNGEPGLAPH